MLYVNLAKLIAGLGRSKERTVAQYKHRNKPVLITQMSSFLTNQRLWGATTFVYHVSYYVYMHLMQYLSLAETLIEKESTEKVMAQSGRSVKHHHADNDRVEDNGFVDAVNSKSQKLTFCGVGAHHQNSITENKNKVLTTGAQKILLHGIRVASNDRQHDLAI